MRPPRFTIANLLLCIVVLGLGFAALRRPSWLWANAWYSTALALLTIAVPAAVYRLGKHRAFWVGFASCGWVYLALSLGPWLHEWASPYLVTTALLDIVYLHVGLSPIPVPPPTGILVSPTPPWIVSPATAPPMDLAPPPAVALGPAQMAGPGGPMMADPVDLSPPSPWSRWTEPDTSSDQVVATFPLRFRLVSPESFQRIGHSQLSLLFGLLGGILARYFHMTRDAG